MPVIRTRDCIEVYNLLSQFPNAACHIITLQNMPFSNRTALVFSVLANKLLHACSDAPGSMSILQKFLTENPRLLLSDILNSLFWMNDKNLNELQAQPDYSSVSKILNNPLISAPKDEWSVDLTIPQIQKLIQEFKQANHCDLSMLLSMPANQLQLTRLKVLDHMRMPIGCNTRGQSLMLGATWLDALTIFGTEKEATTVKMQDIVNLIAGQTSLADLKKYIHGVDRSVIAANGEHPPVKTLSRRCFGNNQGGILSSSVSGLFTLPFSANSGGGSAIDVVKPIDVFEVLMQEQYSFTDKELSALRGSSIKLLAFQQLVVAENSDGEKVLDELLFNDKTGDRNRRSLVDIIAEKNGPLAVIKLRRVLRHIAPGAVAVPAKTRDNNVQRLSR